MPHSNETAYVKQQYATSANLDARIALHRNFSTARETYPEWYFQHVHLPVNACVLEVGCGSGAIWQDWSKKISRNWKITLSDFSFGMAQTARGKSDDARFTFADCDAQDLPFDTATFDGIFANHMLYHVPNPDRALQEMRRVLKQGGVLYAATNGLEHMRELRDLTVEITQQPATTDVPERVFGLENGAAMLARHFPTVTREIQDNDLRVTDVDMLVAYVKSGWLYADAVAVPAWEQEFRRRVQNEIDTRGAFQISKAVGLFIAR